MSRIWQALRAAERERAIARETESSRPELLGMEDAVAQRSDPSREGESADRRQTLRHCYETSVLIYGSDPEKQPFHEQSETIDANDNGCLILLACNVTRGQRLVLTNMRNSAEQECRVVYIGARENDKARVGVEFLKSSPHFWRLT